jgi:predicted CopG family antitoxin
MNAISITLEPDAFARLSSARTSDRESWSEVVRRAVWNEAPPTRRGAEILEELRSRTKFLDEEALSLIEAADRSDKPPVNPWLEES